MKKIIEKFLARLTQRVLKKYHPEIIGITGSVGKTSTKEAIFAVLKNKYRVRANIKNYNTELGVPLTILNQTSGNKNILKWLKIFWCSWWSLIIKTDKNYPQILVLEMAADHPGDIEYLTKLAPCKIGIVTAIGPTHMEFFGNIENLIKEKEKILSHLNQGGYAVLNADDNLVMPMKKNTSAQIITYGLDATANVKAKDINYWSNGSGITCYIIFNHEETKADFKNIVSISQLGSLLAGIAVGVIYKLPLEQVVLNLQTFRFPKGRLNLIPGTKNTLIIDDTYNSSPKAVKVALEVLSRLDCSGKRIAVLGDMLELGNFTEISHQEVGEWLTQFKVDKLITIGERAKHIAQTAEINGLSTENIHSFDNADEAKKFVQNEIKTGDLILVKGSQGMRLEKIVKEIMAEPQKAAELLVRQDKDWLGK